MLFLYNILAFLLFFVIKNIKIMCKTLQYDRKKKWFGESLFFSATTQ